MGKGENNIHRNGADITQRLMALNMIGERPLIALTLETSKVAEVLSTDLPDIQTKDDKADTLYLLEDGTFLHVEYQTTAKKEDVLRFAGYVMGLYNNYKDKSPVIKSVVVYAPHISPETVVDTLDMGVLRYKFESIFLRDLNLEERYQRVFEKIKQNPAIHLTDEEKMVIVYRPLANSDKKEIEKDSLRIVQELGFLENEAERAKLGSSIFVLMKKYLSDQAEKAILEELYKMDTVKEWYVEKHKADMKPSIVKALKKGATLEMVMDFFKDADFTQEEIEEILKEAESE